MRKLASILPATLALASVALSGCNAGNQVTVPIGKGRNGAHGGTWPAPKLQAPEVVSLSQGKTNLQLDPQRDYIVRLPKGRPLEAPHGLQITGGHNVVLIGGSVHVPGKSGAVVLKNQTGTMHMEGVRLTGPQLMEGIDLSQERGAVVQLENIYVSTVHGSVSTNHADLIQSWAGPRRLLIDGFVGSTDYQGFYLLPNQLYDGPAPELFDFRNVYIDARRGGYALWRSDPKSFPVRLSNVYVSPNPTKRNRDWWLWPKPSQGGASWSAVKVGRPPTSTLTRVQAAGTGYRVAR